MRRVTGTICFATESGLGIEARAFITHGVVDKILIAPHARYANYPEWYTQEQRCPDEDALLRDCERLMFFESAFGREALLRKARERGVKLVLMTHYEFTGPVLDGQFDALVAPSDEDLRHYSNAVRINVPADAAWRQRTRALTFVHNAGHGGVKGRNGTQELLDAMVYVKSPIKLIVRVQPSAHVSVQSNDPRVELRLGTAPSEELFDEGDVFVMPDKFGGSFLPMQEAFASGMLVMASDRENNRWLPNEFLIPVDRYVDDFIRLAFKSAVVTPRAIAAKIDEIYGQDITSVSLAGRTWAEVNSWDALRGAYEAL